MNTRISHLFPLMAAALLTVTACSTESETDLTRTEAIFTESLGGPVSPMQWWRTAVTLQVKLTAPDTTQLWLMTGNDQGLLCDYHQADASGTLRMVAPQGKGTRLYLVTVCNRQKDVHEITLTGNPEQSVEVKIELRPTNEGEFSTRDMASAPFQPLPEVKTASSLYGSSLAGNAHYNELTSAQLSEALQLITRAYKEYIPAKTLGANCDYELKSNGDFEVTWFAGNCQSSSSHVFGYYYHTPGTYDDIQYVDLSETEIYDYIDGWAKVQYQVDETAAQLYDVLPNHWFDANFDMGDTFDKQAPHLSARAGDDAYNTIDVLNRYGSHLTRLRGVAFTLKVPEGKYVGFYDRVENVPFPEQYDRFVKLGIKPYTTRDKFKAMNFSCEAMNIALNGSYRSSVFRTPNALWLGLENDYTGGDLDCNDVMLQVSADHEIHRPSVVEPDLRPFGEYDSIMPWTIAYEDLARQPDFDFNDAVIQLLPDPEAQTCCVRAMAVGSTAQMFLHYDGPDGDVNLGEMHALLGTDTHRRVNTTLSTPEVPFASVGCVKWPSGYTMEQDARRFYIEVKRGTCADCSDILMLPTEPGQVPEALLVAGEWKWPREGVAIQKAYPEFPAWGRNSTQLSHWGWYAAPTQGTCVSY